MMQTSVTSYVMCAAACLPTARLITLSFSLTTFTTPLFCRGVTLQQSTERQCLASSMKRSCRSGDSTILRVRPSMTSEMFWVVPTLQGSALYLLTSSSVQSKMDVHVNWEDTPHYLTVTNLWNAATPGCKKGFCHLIKEKGYHFASLFSSNVLIHQTFLISVTFQR